MKNSVVPAAAFALIAWSAAATPADVTLPKGTSIEVRVVTPFDSAGGQGILSRPQSSSPCTSRRLSIPEAPGSWRDQARLSRSPRQVGAIAITFETLHAGASARLEGGSPLRGRQGKKILEQEASSPPPQGTWSSRPGTEQPEGLSVSAQRGTEYLADELARPGLLQSSPSPLHVLAMRGPRAALTWGGVPGGRDRNFPSRPTRCAARSRPELGVYAG